jgi:G3E family GTPase
MLNDRGLSLGEEDHRSIVELLIDQIEFADVVILNKVELAGDDAVGQVRGVVERLNPRAKIIETNHCRVPLSSIINTGLFDLEQARQSPEWLREARTGEHLPETTEYGIGHFVYRRRRPFHPGRFAKFLTGSFKGVLRAKGYFWLATKNSVVCSLSQAGRFINYGPVGMWGAAVPRINWPDDEETRRTILENWQEPWGDRRQELVFIGRRMDRDLIEERLDACLLTDEEYAGGPERWEFMADPFPAWEMRMPGAV